VKLCGLVDMCQSSFQNELDWSVYTCLTQLYDGRDMYIIYYIKKNYMFRPFSLAIFRLINEIVLLDKYIHSNLVYYKHNGDDEPYDSFQNVCTILMNCRVSHVEG